MTCIWAFLCQITSHFLPSISVVEAHTHPSVGSPGLRQSRYPSLDLSESRLGKGGHGQQCAGCLTPQKDWVWEGPAASVPSLSVGPPRGSREGRQHAECSKAPRGSSAELWSRKPFPCPGHAVPSWTGQDPLPCSSSCPVFGVLPSPCAQLPPAPFLVCGRRQPSCVVCSSGQHLGGKSQMARWG